MDALSEGRLTSEHFWICMDSVSYPGLQVIQYAGESRIQNAQKCSPREFHILWLMSGSSSSMQTYWWWMLLVQHWSLDLASQVPAQLKKGLTRPRLLEPALALCLGRGNTPVSLVEMSATRHSKPSAWEQKGSARCVYNRALLPCTLQSQEFQTPLM